MRTHLRRKRKRNDSIVTDLHLQMLVNFTQGRSPKTENRLFLFLTLIVANIDNCIISSKFFLDWKQLYKNVYDYSVIRKWGFLICSFLHLCLLLNGFSKFILIYIILTEGKNIFLSFLTLRVLRQKYKPRNNPEQFWVPWKIQHEHSCRGGRWVQQQSACTEENLAHFNMGIVAHIM